MSDKRTETVTIPLEEYTALLMKERPSDMNKALVKGIKDAVIENCKTEARDYYQKFHGLAIKDDGDFIREIMNTIYYTDREAFCDIYKAVASAEEKQRQNDAKMKLARDVKEMKEDESND